MIVNPDGPIPAKIMIVGEAPGAEEERSGKPFMGASGHELDRMLSEIGIGRFECFITNVVRERPPNNDINVHFAKAKKDRTSQHTKFRDKYVTKQVVDGINLLYKEISFVKPNIVITLGNVSMWALTGKWGITKWRGSMLYADDSTGNKVCKVIPTYHPAAILRQWSWRAITLNDLRRAKRFKEGEPYPIPEWKFIIRPTYEQATKTLYNLTIRAYHSEPLRLSFDIETRNGHIACIGISWSLTEAICIPFMAVGKPAGYWSFEEEAEIVFKLYLLLTHPNVRVVGQNLLYDCQYTKKHWGFVPNVVFDTMIGQHALFSDLPKSLAFLASMYCNYYVYWKDEGKGLSTKDGEDDGWFYNCEDCVYTDEVAFAIEKSTESMGLEAVQANQQAMFFPVLQAMQRGVKIDLQKRKDLTLEVQDEIIKRQKFLYEVLGHDINPDSPKQMHTLFYSDFKMPVQMTRAKKGIPARATLDDDALQKLVRVEPLLKPIINAIADIRTLNKFLSNFLYRPLSDDGRMRCSYNIGGSASGKSAPKTYRLSSSEDAFGTGTNLQTIPSEKSKSIGKAVNRGGISFLGDPYQFPNIRRIFIPDPGYTWFDLDLERADLFVVCWEAEDEQLKTAMRLGVDIHLLNAYVISGKNPPPLEELIETHPKYSDHYGPMKHQRQYAKVFVHGTDYGGQPRTMAAHTGRTVAEIDRAQRIWFGAHPGIKRWHDRVKAQVITKRCVENRFGYRWYIFDRIDSIIPEAISWIPQSTVSIVINKIWRRVYETLPEIEILMQVHDSLPGQMPTDQVVELLPKLRECCKITVPYSDPLVIPVSIKTSERSWGDC
jgi:uracil-DNA glycosylase